MTAERSGSMRGKLSAAAACLGSVPARSFSFLPGGLALDLKN
jgi:hypothetical protein